MKNSNLILIPALGLTMSILYACANTASVARVHPEAVTGMPDCTECHADSWGALNHKAPDFMAKHKIYAGSKFACASCHQESFCADCHAHKEEIKPSDKFKDSPERSLPHRGDYLSQHKIDGKVDPASCVKCHGRQNNEGCKTCHR
ncbi:cytochrome C [Geobacter sp. FeAm09]|uniref:cytochrome C n=1 Tax=Geobacter sp. FeAm09 TaxID=2597769 RepID=UPI0011EC2BE7|nr:cytochrome C [Geobacter sp. FeAm09]QEM68542.1 cytochrome C [Geobacter sp. FeAm09]